MLFGCGKTSSLTKAATLLCPKMSVMSIQAKLGFISHLSFAYTVNSIRFSSVRFCCTEHCIFFRLFFEHWNANFSLTASIFHLQVNNNNGAGIPTTNNINNNINNNNVPPAWVNPEAAASNPFLS